MTWPINTPAFNAAITRLSDLAGRVIPIKSPSSTAANVSGPAQSTQTSPAPAVTPKCRRIADRARRMQGNRTPQDVEAFLERHLILAKAPYSEVDDLRKEGLL